MLTQPILNSLTALVFFLSGGLGSPNLPPIPPPRMDLLRAAAPALAPKKLGNRVVELTQRLEPVPTFEIPGHTLYMVLKSDPELRAHINLLVKKYASRYKIDERLIRAVLNKESGGNPIAVSPKGAMGLMQLMPETAASLGVDDPFDAEQNVAGGVKYLKYCLNRFNQDIALALAAYNAGPGAVEKHGGVPPYRETEQYVAGILGLPVEDVKNKNRTEEQLNKAAEQPKSPGDKPDTRQVARPAARLPKPSWSIVRSEVTVPAPKWKIHPSVASLNSPPLKDDIAAAEAARFTRNYSSLRQNDKEAVNPSAIAIPGFLKKPHSW